MSATDPYPTDSLATQTRNFRLLFASGVTAVVSKRMIDPKLVLPFLYLALGAPTVIAGLLLPCVKAAKLLAEVIAAPYLRRPAWAKLANVLPYAVVAMAILVFLLFAEHLSSWGLAVVFILLSFAIGFCRGIAKLGKGQIIAMTMPHGKRRSLVFLEPALASAFVILLVLATKHFGATLSSLETHMSLLWLGIGACVITASLFSGLLVATPEPSQDASAPTVRFKDEIRDGLQTGFALPWYRRFMTARLLFLSVDLAMPFYTIHAATFHVGTAHGLSMFVIAAAVGRALGALFWNRLSRDGIRQIMLLGCLIAGGAAGCALIFDWVGLAQNIWAYAFVIGLLAFGQDGLNGGRFLYLLKMSDPHHRPGLIALTDVASGVLAIVLAAALGIVAHWHSETAPLIILIGLNLAAAVAVLRMIEPPKDPTSDKGV